MGAGRYGDAVLWLDVRRKFNDSVEAMCRAERKKDKPMVEEKLRRVLYLMLSGISPVADRQVTVTELVDDDKIRVHLTRPYGQKGEDVIVLTLSSSE